MTYFGLQIPNFTFPGTPDDQIFDRVVQIATTAERAGFDSLWVMDHFYQIGAVGPRTDPMLEAYTLLAAIAARTSRIHLGAMVTGVTYRNPALLAKMITTLDVISKGRAILGIGAAWNEDEHRGYGFDFPPIKERMDRLEEALQICRSMFTKESPSFQGRYYRLDEALNFPRPLQPGGPRILVGGGGERRTLKLVAKYADMCNVFGDVEIVRHKMQVLRQHCESIGRDPAEILKTRLGALIIAPTQAEAERVIAAVRAQTSMDEERFRGFFIAGGPDAVAEQIQAYLDAGLDGLVFSETMRDPEDLESVALAGRVLKERFPTAR